MENETIINQIKEKLAGDELTGRCLDDSCTDGYDTHLTLLAIDILNLCKDGLNVDKK